MPDKELKPRLMRLADFTAEALEQEADGMPASFKDRADILREMAKTFRERDHSPMIRVWEEEEGPMDLDELKEKATARGYKKIQRDVENAPIVTLKDWPGFSSHVSGGLSATVTYYLTGNKVRVAKALDTGNHWYTLSK